MHLTPFNQPRTRQQAYELVAPLLRAADGTGVSAGARFPMALAGIKDVLLGRRTLEYNVWTRSTAVHPCAAINDTSRSAGIKASSRRDLAGLPLFGRLLCGDWKLAAMLSGRRRVPELCSSSRSSGVGAHSAGRARRLAEGAALFNRLYSHPASQKRRSSHGPGPRAIA